MRSTAHTTRKHGNAATLKSAHTAHYLRPLDKVHRVSSARRNQFHAATGDLHLPALVGDRCESRCESAKRRDSDGSTRHSGTRMLVGEVSCRPVLRGAATRDACQAAPPGLPGITWFVLSACAERLLYYGSRMFRQFIGLSRSYPPRDLPTNRNLHPQVSDAIEFYFYARRGAVDQYFSTTNRADNRTSASQHTRPKDHAGPKG